MKYSLNLLTTWAQCDAVLAYVRPKMGLLDLQDTQTDHRTDNLVPRGAILDG